MSIFAFLGGRHNAKAWGKALAEAGCRLPEKPDIEKYARATEQIIENDCRIIEESARMILESSDPDVLTKRRMMMFTRFTHVSRLEPFATAEQWQAIKKAKKAAAKARKVK